MPTRIVAGLELVLIVFPTTGLALWGTGAIVGVPISAERIAFASALAVALIATAGVWRLLTPLMLGGYRLVRAAASAWWLAVWGGGAFVIVGIIISVLVRWLTEPSDALRSVLGSITVVAFFGLPMRLPLTHLVVERLRDARASGTPAARRL